MIRFSPHELPLDPRITLSLNELSLDRTFIETRVVGSQRCLHFLPINERPKLSARLSGKVSNYRDDCLASAIPLASRTQRRARAQKLHAMPRQKDGTFMEPLARDNSRQYFEGARYIERDTWTCVHTSGCIEYNLGITSRCFEAGSYSQASVGGKHGDFTLF